MANTNISVELMVTCGDSAFASVPLSEVAVQLLRTTLHRPQTPHLVFICPFCKHEHETEVGRKD